MPAGLYVLAVSTLAIALAAVAATLIGSFIVAPLVGRRLKRNQRAPELAGQLVAIVNGENDTTAAVVALGREALRMPEYTVVKGPVRLELREGGRVVRATLSSTSAARLSASLLAILPDDIDRDTADAFLDHLHRPNGPGGPLPGCPNLVDTSQATFRGGFCDQHVGEAIIDAVENLGGRIEIARALEDQEEHDQP